MWTNFNGLKGKAQLDFHGQNVHAEFQIDSLNTVKVSLPAGDAQAWLQEYLESMVQHRLPDENSGEQVTYVTENKNIPSARNFRSAMRPGTVTIASKKPRVRSESQDGAGSLHD